MPPGQQRSFIRPLIPHLAWEGVLLVLLLAVVVAARIAEPRLFGYDVFWTQWATLGLLASAVALSLRMGTPNLAIPGLAAVGGNWFVGQVNDGSSGVVAGFLVVVVCLLVGLLLGGFVALTRVPAWAASLGALALLQSFVLADAGGTITQLRPGGPPSGVLWFLLFALASVAGAVALATPAVRARLVHAAPAALIGLGGSSAVAGLAGVLVVRRVGASQVSVPFDLFLLALGVALLAGVSVYGGQGPIFGVVLAGGIATAVVVWSQLATAPVWSQLVIAGVLILLGLVVGWLVALISRRIPA